MSSKKKEKITDKAEQNEVGETSSEKNIDLEALVFSLADSVSKMQLSLAQLKNNETVGSSSTSQQQNINIEKKKEMGGKQYVSLWKDLGGQNLVFYPSTAMHPMDFLNKLAYLFEQAEVPESVQVGMAVNCLKGSALDWAAYRAVEFKNFEEFKAAFKKRYWGIKEECELCNEGKCGQFKTGSLSDYFLKLVRRSLYLSRRMSEEELVNNLSKHFSDEIRQGIIINGLKIVDDVENYLKDIDTVSGGCREGCN